jgi:hypothetical protein
MRRPFVQRRMFAKLSQLEMNYRGCGLSSHFDGMFSRVRVRAGDRTPDVVFEKAGEKVSLFQLVRRGGMIALLGPGEHSEEIASKLAAMHILAFVVSPDGADMAAGENFKDLYGDFARLYGARGPFLYLIRPDGHVGLFQRQAEISELSRYLKKIRPPEVIEENFDGLR